MKRKYFRMPIRDEFKIDGDQNSFYLTNQYLVSGSLVLVDSLGEQVASDDGSGYLYDPQNDRVGKVNWEKGYVELTDQKLVSRLTELYAEYKTKTWKTGEGKSRVDVNTEPLMASFQSIKETVTVYLACPGNPGRPDPAHSRLNDGYYVRTILNRSQRV